MDESTYIRRQQHLANIYAQLQTCEEFYLAAHELQALGISASPASVAEKGEVIFTPGFFRAYPYEVLAAYSLDEIHQNITYFPHVISPLRDVPNLDSQLRAHEHIVDPEARLEAARQSLILRLSEYWLEWNVVRRVHNHVDSQLVAFRLGLPDGFMLLHLGSLQRDYMENIISGSDPSPFSTGVNFMHWKIEDLLQDFDEQKNPHAIISVLTETDASAEPESLTLHEVHAIVTMMMIRTSHGPWARDTIQPLLVITYTGEGSVRITQASWHGETLVLQFSPLWDLQHSESAPVDLIVRHYLSQLEPVDPAAQRGPDFNALAELASGLTLGLTSRPSDEQMDMS
ncbi:Uncharacterized protein PECH_002594 [Penicillium ucsense]|uniref:Uncharacterized protein n=1 Tax=Penicillium ucsense TaxID=2839758 RepID=A0A8J8W049_9EURO|nr:Uncharacterized protein PECM_002050 [Penicillium ucsense]KAF7730639.1 Uncharacterized protein PECH_002594 [Penicillium ucsense]